MLIFEITGWLGMAFVVCSFIFTGEKRMRILNSIGCALQVIFFILQGFFISWKTVTTNLPIVCLNIFVLLLNVYHLGIAKKQK